MSGKADFPKKLSCLTLLFVHCGGLDRGSPSAAADFYFSRQQCRQPGMGGAHAVRRRPDKK